ncbi:hypothetical protein [Brevundimonas vesicularis]
MKDLTLKVVLGVGVVAAGVSALVMIMALGIALFAAFSPAG